MVLTTEQLDMIDNKCNLAGYPKSQLFTVGYELHVAGHTDLAIDAFKRGAKEVSCVPSMFYYAELQSELQRKLHLAIPFYIEAAIRGHIGSIHRLIRLYQESKPTNVTALIMHWLKMTIELGNIKHKEESRKEIKKNNSNICAVCGKQELEDNDVTLVKCGICKYYSYCGKDCQTRHWSVLKHMHECRHVILLRKYCKLSYVKEIRGAIIGGQDPKEIHTLQRLLMKLGLNRPKEEYKELLLILGNDDTTDTNRSPNRYEHLVGRKDGTLHIGSTPNVI